MIGDATVYCLNSAAVGDLIAAAPSIKYAIDNFHKRSEYRIGIYEDFKCLYPFVPADKFVEVKAEYDKTFTIRYLNMLGVGGRVCKLTPSRLNLTSYASIGLLGRVLKDYESKYIPLPEVPIYGYGIDFSKAVIIVTTYRDKQRTILAPEITKIAEYVHSKGLTPVYVGKVGAISIWKNNLAKTDFEYPGFGVDLRDKTTFLELASIMKNSRAVVGMDSGPIHLAYTTDVPVVCGYTTVAPEYRIPYRSKGKTEAITPNIKCRFCESDWSLNTWNFNNCPRKLELAECVTEMKAEKFIDALTRLGVFL